MSNTRISRALPIACASALAGAMGCSSAVNGVQATPDGGGRAEASISQPVEAATNTGAGYTRIDDMEETTGHLEWMPPVGVPGAWATDMAGSTSPGSSYALLPTPYETFRGITSRHAARMRTTQPLVNNAYASMFIEFALQAPDAGLPASGKPPMAVDLSMYKGITFWAMAAQNPDTATIEVKFLDTETTPSGRACLDADGGTQNCFSGYSVTLNLTGTFTQYTIDFSSFAATAWGYHPLSSVLDVQNVRVLAFNVNTPGGSASLTFDVWVDDLYFVNK